jgi:copper chaperone
MQRTTYAVTGMTCEHCEHRVATELLAIDGVSAATADATTGQVVVDSETVLDTALVADAVEEAGYELAR